MASVVSALVFPVIHVSLILYAVLLLITDISFACSVATIGLAASIIVFLRYGLPPSDAQRVADFFKHHRHINEEDADCEECEQLLQLAPASKVLLVAHRTLALDAPENSLSGIREAGFGGFDAVEFDVRLSADGELVLFHDPSLDRTTNELGNVKDMTVEQLKQLDISSNHLFNTKFEGEVMPTFEEAIRECAQLGLKMFIDIKEPNHKTLSILRDLYAQSPLLFDHVMIVCASPLFLYQVRAAIPDVLTGLGWRPRSLSLQCLTGVLDHASARYNDKWKQVLAIMGDKLLDWSVHSIVWYLCGVCAILAHKDAVSREYLKVWRERGIEVLAWPVNDPSEKQYFVNALKIGYLTDTKMPNP